MSLVDSNAVFESRALSIGIAQPVINALATRGWVTHATFAFAVATNPAAGDDQNFIDGVLVPILGDEGHIDAPKLRRLFYESHTLTSADLRRKVEANEQEAPRKLPPPEIAQRLEALQARVRPLVIQNVLEPSHQLINSLVQCVEDGRVRYIEWSKCTSRSQEVNNTREDSDLKVWKTDASGVVKAVSKEPDIQAILTTELDVHNALRRRGAAYEIAQAMSFEVHETLLNFYFYELKKDPLEGFAQVSLAQVAAADRELHVRLAELTRGGLHPGPNGQLPLDDHVRALLQGPEIKWMLMPLPKRQVIKPVQPIAAANKPKVDSDSKRDRDGDSKKTKADAARLKKLRRTPMPKQLMGGVPCDEQGRPFCFAFNLGSCPNGDECKKGMHLCCKKGCKQKHAFVSAHKSS